MKIRKIEDVMK